MITYFQGFDVNTIPTGLTGLNAGGDDDASPDWFANTTTRPPYTAGYLGGQAIRMTSFGPLGGSVPSSNNTARFGAWIKTTALNNASLNVCLLSVALGNPRYALKLAGNGQLSFWYHATSPSAGTQLATGPTWATSSDWAHFEVVCSGADGSWSVKMNGVVIMSAASGPLSSNNVTQPELGGNQHNNISVAWDLAFDHVYFGDSAELVDDVLGVAINPAQERYQGSNRLAGTIIVNGLRYLTAPRSAPVSSISNSGRNVANVTPFFFMKHPATNLPWTEATLSDINQWGVCFDAFLPAGRFDKVRLAGLTFNILRRNNGMPIIDNTLPGSTAYFSGPWEKSDPTLTFGGHFQTAPRPNTEFRADALSLYINDFGCILFNFVPPGQPGPELFRVGLTFAEEFREDYRDWVRVTGSGSSFESMFSSGYSVLGEGNKKFQDNFVTVNYRNVPTGSCYIQGLWDYANSGDSGRWSMRQTIDNKGGDYTHGTRRLKIRGHGKAMQLRVTNKGDTPFVINGWSMFITGNATV